LALPFGDGRVGQVFGGDVGCGFFGSQAEFAGPQAHSRDRHSPSAAKDLRERGVVHVEEQSEGAQRVTHVLFAATTEFVAQTIEEGSLHVGYAIVPGAADVKQWACGGDRGTGPILKWPARVGIGSWRYLVLESSFIMKSNLLAELVAEFLGTLVLILFGNGVVAMVQLFGHGLPGEIVNGGYTNVTVAWGLGVTMGIYIAGRISGAHLNPAVTVALAAWRGFPWRKVLPYCVAQVAGAFVAAGLVFWNYHLAFIKADPGLDHTAGIFTTFPAFPDALSAGLLDQIIGTALLLLMIFALTDERNQPPAQLGPLMIGLVVVGIGMSFGGMHGYAINPARDFGPRLFTVVAGFRNNGLTDGGLIFWVPIVGPIVGGLLGGFVYDKVIGRFLHRITA
jgi:glycerol uptake facilitator protein